MGEPTNEEVLREMREIRRECKEHYENGVKQLREFHEDVFGRDGLRNELVGRDDKLREDIFGRDGLRSWVENQFAQLRATTRTTIVAFAVPLVALVFGALLTIILGSRVS